MVRTGFVMVISSLLEILYERQRETERNGDRGRHRYRHKHRHSHSHSHRDSDSDRDREYCSHSDTLTSLPLCIFQIGLRMSNDTYEKLVNTIVRDCTVLESFKIMDYSLLMGLHNPARGGETKMGR